MTHTHKTFNVAVLQTGSHKTLRNNVVKVLSDFDISTAEWTILGYIYQHKSARFIDLAIHLDVEPPHITTLIDILEIKKLVERKDDLNDRRAKRLILTKSAIDLIPQVEIKLSARMGHLLNGITPEEMKTYFKILETIIKNGIEMEKNEKLSSQEDNSKLLNLEN